MQYKATVRCRSVMATGIHHSSVNHANIHSLATFLFVLLGREKVFELYNQASLNLPEINVESDYGLSHLFLVASFIQMSQQCSVKRFCCYKLLPTPLIIM